MGLKKDIFNHNIKPEYKAYTICSIVLLVTVMLAGGTFFLYISLSYENMEPFDRIGFLVFSALEYLTGIVYPILTFYAIRTFPKHKKLAYAMLKKFLFVDGNTNGDEYEQEK